MTLHYLTATAYRKAYKYEKLEVSNVKPVLVINLPLMLQTNGKEMKAVFFQAWTYSCMRHREGPKELCSTHLHIRISRSLPGQRNCGLDNGNTEDLGRKICRTCGHRLDGKQVMRESEENWAITVKSQSSLQKENQGIGFLLRNLPWANMCFNVFQQFNLTQDFNTKWYKQTVQKSCACSWAQSRVSTLKSRVTNPSKTKGRFHQHWNCRAAIMTEKLSFAYGGNVLPQISRDYKLFLENMQLYSRLASMIQMILVQEIQKF